MSDKDEKNVTHAISVVEPGILVYLHVLHGLGVCQQRQRLNQSEPAIYLTSVAANGTLGREVKSRSLKNSLHLKRQE